jgi:hypothetical protein
MAKRRRAPTFEWRARPNQAQRIYRLAMSDLVTPAGLQGRALPASAPKPDGIKGNVSA